KFFAPAVALPQGIEQSAAHRTAAAVRHPHSQALVTVEYESRFASFLLALQIRNDHDGKLEAFRLVNRHQTNDVSRFIHLPLAFASADGFGLFDVMDKIANQMT